MINRHSTQNASRQGFGRPVHDSNLSRHTFIVHNVYVWPSEAAAQLDAGPFSISAPLGWEFHQRTGVDSYVGKLVGNGVTLTFDFGRYSAELRNAKKPAYSVAKKSIGGRTAKVVRPRTPGNGVTGMYVRLDRHDALCLWGKDPYPVSHAAPHGAGSIAIHLRLSDKVFQCSMPLRRSLLVVENRPNLYIRHYSDRRQRTSQSNRS